MFNRQNIFISVSYTSQKYIYSLYVPPNIHELINIRFEAMAVAAAAAAGGGASAAAAAGEGG